MTAAAVHTRKQTSLCGAQKHSAEILMSLVEPLTNVAFRSKEWLWLQ